MRRPLAMASSCTIFTVSVTSMSDDSVAAMKAAQWCAFSQAVW